MTLAQALIALAEGKKVQEGVYQPHEYVHLVDGVLLNEKGKRAMIAFDNDDHWELYNEPKPKKVVFEWLVEGFIPFISTDLWTEKMAKERWPNAKLTPLRSFEVEG